LSSHDCKFNCGGTDCSAPYHNCKKKYSIEKHGDGYAIYYGRCNHFHGMNLMHISEVYDKHLLNRIEKLLNK